MLQISEVIGQDFKNQILWNCPGRSKDTFTKDELGPPSIRFGDTSLQLTGISAGISCWEKEKSEKPYQQIENFSPRKILQDPNNLLDYLAGQIGA